MWKKIKSFIRLIYRNNEVLGNNVLKKRRINLEWWNVRPNVGDCLAPVIYDYIIKYYNLDENTHKKRTIHLMTVGSIIGIKSYDAVIWGAGIHLQENIYNMMRKRKIVEYDIRAVRGPLTRQILMGSGYECPQVYGDPAILMPQIYCKQEISEKKYPISVVIHLNQKYQKRKELHYIEIKTDDYKGFIDEICNSSLVIASSLHAIILAESYGVPAIFLLEGVEKEIIKYYDWYYSTGRYSVSVARSLDEALKMEPMPLPDLEKMRTELISSFPIDLWKE